MKAHHLNAQGKVLGRLASETAKLLMGKDSPDFARHRVSESRVVVYNAAHLTLHPKKAKQKLYRRHSGYLGSLKEEPLEKVFQRSPALVIRRAVSGMLPKNKLRARLLKHLIIYSDTIPQQ